MPPGYQHPLRERVQPAGGNEAGAGAVGAAAWNRSVGQPLARAAPGYAAVPTARRSGLGEPMPLEHADRAQHGHLRAFRAHANRGIGGAAPPLPRRKAGAATLGVVGRPDRARIAVRYGRAKRGVAAPASPRRGAGAAARKKRSDPVHAERVQRAELACRPSGPGASARRLAGSVCF